MSECAALPARKAPLFPVATAGLKELPQRARTSPKSEGYMHPTKVAVRVSVVRADSDEGGGGCGGCGGKADDEFPRSLVAEGDDDDEEEEA